MGKRQRNRLRLEENATDVAERLVGDLVPLTIDEAAVRTGGVVAIRLISPGWGSSGYYSPEVLERDGAQAFPAGTHMFIDHPGNTEAVDRPERSLRDLAAVLETGARWIPNHQDGPGLYATAKVYEAWRPFVAEAAADIGVSIRAAGEGHIGEVDGRRGRIIDRIVEGRSVDFVTRAGRGGAVVALLESAGLLNEARNVAGWFESRIHLHFTTIADDMFGEGRLTKDERLALSTGISAALDAFSAVVAERAPQLADRDLYDVPGEGARMVEAGLYADDLRDRLRAALIDRYGDGTDSWCWVRDFNDETVVFELGGDDVDRAGTFQIAYSLDDDDLVVLGDGEPTEVKVTTTYTPVTTDPTQEASMPITPEERAEITESVSTAVLAALTESGVITPPGNDTTPDELAEANTRAARAEEAVLVMAAERHVGAELDKVTLPAPTRARLTEAVCKQAVAGEDGKLDVAKLDEALKTAVDDEVKYLAEATGSPVRGLGGVATATPSVEVAEKLEGVFADLGLSEGAAKRAAAGR